MTTEKIPDSGDGSLFKMPPSPKIVAFAGFLRTKGIVGATILDIGCCEGRNSIYLSEQGHNVIGVSKSFDEVLAAKRRSKNSVLDLNRCDFINGDATRLMFRAQFDAVVINEVLQELSDHDARNVLSAARELTRYGGYNAISGYIADSRHDEKGEVVGCFNASRLASSYITAGWDVLNFSEDMRPPILAGERQYVSSIASIIAQKI